jgi:CheY-like chemotaxis protein
MVLFTRVQHRTIVENYRIRFENADLLEQVRNEKGKAEQAREAAERANLAKSQFLAAASHDLRQPLYALGLFSSTLQGLRLDSKAREIVRKIHGSIAALEGLFDALLDISKLEAGVVRPSPAPFPVAALFERLRGYHLPEAERRGLRLRFAATGHWADGDAALVERVLGNFIANAIRYTPSGAILVGCRRASRERLRIEVRDSGIGILEEDRERIFEDFIQLGNPERDRRKGLGLGLAIARRTAELLGSAIELRSAPGRGSVFAISLDASPPQPPQPQPAEPSVDLSPDLRVLLIDDESAIRDALAGLFRSWGIETEAAADEQEALTMTEQSPPFDLVIADYRLGGAHNGLDVLRAIALRQAPPPRTLLVTGDIDPDLLALAGEQGIPLLHKPVRPARLRAVVQSVIAERARHRVE